MTESTKQSLYKSLRYWGASTTLLTGFLYYKTNMPLGPILIAAIVTLGLTIMLTLRK